MTDDEFMQFYAKTRPLLETHLMFRSNFRLRAQDLEDLIQETFLRFLGVRDLPPLYPVAWIKTVATNLLIDRWRPTASIEFIPLDENIAEITTDDDFLATEALRVAIQDLTPDQQEVLYQTLTLGRTHAEIALSTGMPATTVAHHLREAKRKLRNNKRLAAIHLKEE